MKKIDLLVMLLCCSFLTSAQLKQPLMNVIFETDMGNDVDDALALDMLYKYMDEGRLKLLAVNSNKNSSYSAPFISLMNRWYGYPKIPVGKMTGGPDTEGDSHNYAQSVHQYTVDGRKIFSAPDTSATYPDAVQLYRQLLARQPDSSVIIISVGFSTNLARLLRSSRDKHSPLSGKDLIASKVKLLSMMAGNFEGERMVEYNVMRDIPAAAIVFKQWPGKIVTSPFELGNVITYPAQSILNDFTWTKYHPVVVAYKNYLPMPYDRPTWDLTAVLYAIEGSQQYFTLTGPGLVSVDDKGYTSFSPSVSGNHYYLKADTVQHNQVRERFIELVTKKPKHFIPGQAEYGQGGAAGARQTSQ